MRTMYMPGSETHVHNDYIIGHHHTLLKVNSGNVIYYNKIFKTSIESNTLVEKSSKPAAPINYHWRFQLSRASKKNKVDPT
jgi:hypothetical protein